MKPQRLISILVIIAFGISVPGRAHADTIHSSAITQVFVSNQRAPDLRISEVSDHRIPVFGFEIPVSATAKSVNRESINADRGSNSLLSGVGFYSLQTQDPAKVPVGDVDVTICDCGYEAVIVPGGFPKWPLVFLAGIPLFFIKGGEDELPPIVVPTPPAPPSSTPPTSTIPEPASLVLLLSGLGAVGFRLRRSRRTNRETTNNEK